MYSCSLVSSFSFYARVNSASPVHGYTRNGYNPDVDITSIYNAWIIDKVNTFNTYIQAGMKDMISSWIAKNGNIATEVKVCESLSNLELSSLTMANRLASDMLTTSPRNPL